MKPANLKFNFVSLLPYFLSILGMVIGLVTSFFLARVLGAEDYGELRYILSLFTTFSSIMIFGLTNFVVREAKNKKHKGAILNKAFSFLSIISIFLIPIIFRICKSYLSIQRTDYLICILVSSFAIAVNSIYASFCQGIGKYHISQLIVNVIPRFIMLAISLSFYFFLDFSWFSDKYILFYTVIYGLVAVLILFRNYRKVDLGFQRSDYLTISFFFATTITYSVTSEITNVIQGSFYDNTVVLGIMGVSNQILSLLSVFTTVVASIISPLFAKYNREHNTDNIFETYRLGLRVTAYVAIPFYIFLITQGDKFLYIFGESYLVYPLIIVFTSIGGAANVLTGCTGTILLMTGKEKIEVFNGIIGIAIYTAFAIGFSFDRIYGLVIANMAHSISVNVAKYIEVKYFYKKNPINGKTWLTFLIVVATDFLLILFVGFISNWIIWLIVGVCVGLISIVLNFVLSPYRTDFKKMLSIRKELTD